jgi:hypothetical protein
LKHNSNQFALGSISVFSALFRSSVLMIIAFGEYIYEIMARTQHNQNFWFRSYILIFMLMLYLLGHMFEIRTYFIGANYMPGLLEEATKYFEYDPEWLRKTEVNKHETNSINSMRILYPPQPTHGRQISLLWIANS